MQSPTRHPAHQAAGKLPGWQFFRPPLAIMLAALVSAAYADPPPLAQSPIRVMAAGSLKAALTSIIAAWEGQHPERPVTLESGPAGWLRQKIESGTSFDLYASAAYEHAAEIHRQGLGEAPILLARNRLCANVRTSSRATQGNILEVLLDPATRIATSTPGTDPGGDYAWEFFRRLDRDLPGTHASISSHARAMYGMAPGSASVSKSPQSLLLEESVDMTIGYCSGAASNPQSAVRSIPLPPPAPIADYATTVAHRARAGTQEFSRFLNSPSGQKILAEKGFLSRPE